MALNIILGILLSILSVYLWIFTFQAIGWFFFRQLGGNLGIFPLDVVDAKELTDMVDVQVEEYLRPLLSSKGYSQEKIKEILTIKAVGSINTFKR